MKDNVSGSPGPRPSLRTTPLLPRRAPATVTPDSHTPPARSTDTLALAPSPQQHTPTVNRTVPSPPRPKADHREAAPKAAATAFRQLLNTRRLEAITTDTVAARLRGGEPPGVSLPATKQQAETALRSLGAALAASDPATIQAHRDAADDALAAYAYDNGIRYGTAASIVLVYSFGESHPYEGEVATAVAEVRETESDFPEILADLLTLRNHHVQQHLEARQQEAKYEALARAWDR